LKVTSLLGKLLKRLNHNDKGDLKMKKALFLIILTFLLCQVTFWFIPSVKADVETRYMRNENSDISGYMVLGTSQTTTATSRGTLSATPPYTVYIGIRVYNRDASGVETEITSGVVAKASYRVETTGSVTVSASWNAPEYANIYRLVVKVYYGRSSSPSTLLEEFATEVLDGNLESATWTVYYRLAFSAGAGGKIVTKFWFGSSSYNSRIENFVWTEAPEAPEAPDNEAPPDTQAPADSNEEPILLLIVPLIITLTIGLILRRS